MSYFALKSLILHKLILILMHWDDSKGPFTTQLFKRFGHSFTQQRRNFLVA